MSQTGYPRKIVWEGDTVFAFTEKQLDLINVVKIQRDEYRELADSLKSQVKKQKILIVAQEDLIASLEEQKDLLDKVVQNDQVIIDELNKEIKKRDRHIKSLKIQRAILGVGAGAAIIAAIIGFSTK